MTAARTDTNGANANIYIYGSRRLSYVRDSKISWGGCDFVVWTQLAHNWTQSTDTVRVVMGIRIAVKLRASSSK